MVRKEGRGYGVGVGHGGKGVGWTIYVAQWQKSGTVGDDVYRARYVSPKGSDGSYVAPRFYKSKNAKTALAFARAIFWADEIWKQD